MDARVLARIWLLTLYFKVIEPSYVLRHDDYARTDNFEPAKPTVRFEPFTATYPLHYESFNDTPMVRISRLSRQVDSEAITTVASTATMESDTASQQRDATEKYSTETTDMPSSSTGTYTPSGSEPLYKKDREKVIPLMTTNYPDSLDVSELYRTNKGIDSSLDSNQEPTTESITLSTQPSILSGKTGTDESSKDLAVVGTPEKNKHKERIMRLLPSKERKYVQLKETIHNMLQTVTLKNETEDYVIQLHRRYDNLPVSDEDNSVWTKYSRAVVESFVLDFCRNFPHYSVSEQSSARWHEVEEYESVYNRTLLHLQQKRSHTAVRIAAPVRRVADIYKAILDTPIGIVQSKCDASMEHWLCLAQYVVRLADISETCEHIWYHAQVHLTVLLAIRQTKGAKDPVEEVIDELDSRLSKIEQSNDVEFLFDVIIETLGELSQNLKELLLIEASRYNLVRELQNEDKLNCLNIDEQGW